MAKIHLTTLINAPVERVFDLSRSINLHRIASSNTYEKAIAGVTTGLINENETVTWEAKHLYKIRKFTTKITSMEFPNHFTVQMVHGDFTSFRHEHYFKPINNGTFLIDVIEFKSPYGIIGQIAEKLFLTSYLHKLLINRNAVIKQYAETNKWKAILN
jgi:ligand-binding SRPBCC domain-containing protein